MLAFLKSIGDVDLRRFDLYLKDFAVSVALRKIIEDRMHIQACDGFAILLYRSAVKEVMAGRLTSYDAVEEYVMSLHEKELRLRQEASKAWEAQAMTV